VRARVNKESDKHCIVSIKTCKEEGTREFWEAADFGATRHSRACNDRLGKRVRQKEKMLTEYGQNVGKARGTRNRAKEPMSTYCVRMHPRCKEEGSLAAPGRRSLSPGETRVTGSWS
jgi:hypothetical protein